MIDSSTSMGRLALSSSLMNAPCARSVTYEDLAEIGRSKSAAIVTASITEGPILPSPRPNYYASDLGSIRTYDFPNLGSKEYAKMIPDLKAFKKPVIASIAASTLEQFVYVAKTIARAAPDIIQLDSNSLVEGRVLGYHWGMMDDVLNAVRQVVDCPLGVSLPPFWDPLNVRTVSLMLVRNEIDYAVLCAPSRIGLMVNVETDEAVIGSDDGVGALDGPAIKAIALADVHLFKQQLRKVVSVLGATGINTGNDVFEFLLAGACAVQVSDAFLSEGTRVFARLESELSSLLQRKGGRSVTDVIGKLRSATASSLAL